MEVKGAKVVVLGGGTGSFTVLSGLRNYAEHITAIVNMVDDGGSTGQLRDELGVLPPGDVRQCLIALSDSSEVIRNLFGYRFAEGSLSGHSFGNIFLTALEKMTGSFPDAIETASEVLNIKGKVVPVTLENVRLAMSYEDGEVITHEGVIDGLHFRTGERPTVFTQPEAKINPEAKASIEDADIIVIAPGTLHTSTLPLLAIEGVSEALSRSRGRVVYICNLVTNSGQTDGYKVHDFTDEIMRYAKAENLLDIVLYNTQKPSTEVLDLYREEGEYWVDYDKTELDARAFQAIGVDFLSGAALEEKLIRHDSDAVARMLMKLYFS